MSGRDTMILYALILSGLFRVSTESGHIEVHFVRYSDTCTEHLGTSSCDPQFSFCLSTPQTGSLSVDNCNYASTGPSSDHFHNTNQIDMEHLTDIKGHPNPWIVTVHRFLGPLVMLVVKATDVDIFNTEEMQTWATELNETIWASEEEAVWAERVMSQNSYTLSFRVRMYCDANYYTTSCDVMCVADNSSSGHYVCEAGTGRKICLPGWQGLQCTEDVDECALSICHSGECTNLPGDYNCSCPVNYTGKNCSVLASPCRLNPCQNGGSCTDHVSEYTFSCTCTPGWAGPTCSRRDACQSLPCLNNGSCANSPNGTDYNCTDYNCTDYNCTDYNCTDYNCTCLYPFAGDRCQVSDPSVWTTIHNTSVETVSTSTSTETSSTFTETSSTSIETSSTLNITGSARELSSFAAVSTKEPGPSEWAKSTASGISVTNVELVDQEEEVSHFESWYVAVIVGVVFIAIVVVLVIVVRKRRSHSKHNVCPPSVSFNGTNVMFQNGIYADANTSSAQAERQSQELPAVPPTATIPTEDDRFSPAKTTPTEEDRFSPAKTTPTEDDRFSPAKPTSYVDVDELGAAGNCTTDQTEPKKKKSVTMDTSALNVVPASERAESNLYADFTSLKDGQKARQTLGTQEGSHYDALDEGTGAGPRDPDTEYSDLTFNLDSQLAPVVTIPASPYDIPSNNSSYYSTPPTRSPMLQPEPGNPDTGTPLWGCEEIEFSNPVLDGDFPARTQATSADSDSSHDEASVQEDIARLRQQVQDKMSAGQL